MNVIITNRAREDLIEIFDYNSGKSIKFAIETDKKIRSYIKDLEIFPYVGRYVPEIPNKRYRERIYKKYRIIYYISEKNKTIYIQYILNSRQNIKRFLKLHIKDLFQFLI